MTQEILKAEKKVKEVLRKSDRPLSVTEVVKEIQKAGGNIMERNIRPSFWLLVSSGVVELDSSFRGKLINRRLSRARA